MSSLTIKSKKVALLRRIAEEVGTTDAAYLTERTNIIRPVTNLALRLLHEAGLMHISSWRKSASGPCTKIYTWGKGTDVTLPVRRRTSRIGESHVKFTPRCDVAAFWIPRQSCP